MRVLKVVAEGLTTSFRYPHFMHLMHPTFEMPPPATIYGHICSALGELVDPAGIEFAYQFTFDTQFDDVEHIHLLESSSGKLPGTGWPKALEGAVNPFKRSLLFRPRLVLYLNRPEWETSFRSPRYAVVLGRSQDLFTYTSIELLDLARSDRAYFADTLVPYDLAMRMPKGYVVLMPRFLNYARRRQPTFERYAVLRGKVHSTDLWQIEGAPPHSPYWVDPTSTPERGSSLGLLFHTFVGGGDET